MKQILTYINQGILWTFGSLFVALPAGAAAVPAQPIFAQSQDATAKSIMVFTVFIIIGAVLTRAWTGILNHSATHDELIAVMEKRKLRPYLPSLQIIVITIVCTAGLFLLSLRTVGGIAPFSGVDGTTKAAVFFTVIGILSIAAQFLWSSAKQYVFAFTVGTVVTFILLGFYAMIFHPTTPQDPFFMALGFVCTVLAWRFLFGPWKPQIKASVLATFIFWVGIHMLFQETPTERSARLLATFIAFIPAVIWCLLFLKEHRQRLNLVLLMFFAGMLSTAPILFYDSLVRHNVELQFFLFRIVPENFSRSSNAFVTGNLVGITGMKSTLIVTLISFLIVGLIEEVSKFWVLRSSGSHFFSSIDDVLQLGIIVAIGFAFAENVMNPSYFLSFVRQYLLYPDSPQWGAFMGNVLGRAILTNRLLQIPERSSYRTENMMFGFLSAVTLHGLFNFLVTLPDLLPGHPRTLGDLFGSSPGSPFHYVALLIIPSLFYVVGGFWILSILFSKKESMKERGVLVETDAFVPSQSFFAQYAK